jgi:ubiquinone/menaquinone biosynthesis C-methylase UbiE
MKRIAAYEMSWKIYDSLLDHVDYDKWYQHITEICKIHNCTPKNYLDLACGTGTFLKYFDDKEIKLYGMELNPNMLELAKAKNAKRQIAWIVSDMQNFSVKDKFDLITCLFDSVNYLQDEDQIIEMFNNVAKHLQKNALFIFDIVSEKTCLEYFFNYTDKDTINGIDIDRYHHYDYNQKIQHTELTFYQNNEEILEHHQQHIYSHEEILDFIKMSNLKYLASYQDFEITKVNQNAERIHYVCSIK